MANKTFQMAFEIAGRMGASFQSAFSSASAQMQRLGAQSVALRGNLKTLDAAYKAGTVNVESYRNAQAQLKAQLQQTQSAQSKLAAAQSQQNEASKRASEIRGRMVDTAVMAAPMVVATRAAIDFETAMGGVAKQVQGARDDNGELTATYYEMQKNIMQLSRDLRMMPATVADTTAAAARMGVQGAEALNEFVKMSVQMGVAFEGNGQEIAETMAKIANIRGIKIDTTEGRQQLRDFADTINYLDDQTTAKGPEILEVLKRISGTAAQSTLSNNELAVLATTMLDLGKTPEIAATGLNALMNRLATAPSQAKSFQGALASLGMEAKQLQSSYMSDSKGTLFGLLDKIKTLDKAQQAEVLTGLFGAEYQDDISSLAAGLDKLRGNFDLLNDSARQGSMEKEFANKLKLTSSAIDGLKQSAAETGISLTQVFLPSIVSVAGSAQRAAHGLAAFQQEHPRLTNALVVGAAGLIGFRLAWLGTVFTLNQARSVVVDVRRLLAAQNAQLVINRTQLLLSAGATKTATAAQWLMNAAMSANPVMLAVGAIGLLIGTTYLLYQNFESVRDAIDGAWQKFQETFPNAAAFLQSVGDKAAWLAEKFKGLFGFQQQAGAAGAPPGMTIAANAAGGIYGRGAFLTTFAEKSKEAAIPLDGSPRAVSLWQKAGEILGVGGGTSIQVTFAPVIHGAGPEIIPELRRQQDDFMDQLQEALWQQRRLALE